MNKEELYAAGVKLAEKFCEANKIPMPAVRRLQPTERLYHLATCAYYRPTTIHIMVEKCAAPGHGGRAWSWPAYVVDRTPYGVIQHELGHHVDNWRYQKDNPFSKRIYEASKEKPLTGYLGTDKHEITFYMEWFAENFRLFVTNPDLSECLRPKFHEAMRDAGLQPVIEEGWAEVLYMHGAPERITAMADKKVKLELLNQQEEFTL